MVHPSPRAFLFIDARARNQILLTTGRMLTTGVSGAQEEINCLSVAQQFSGSSSLSLGRDKSHRQAASFLLDWFCKDRKRCQPANCEEKLDDSNHYQERSRLRH
jgi:hypothetical protein